ncbi:PREDICTED: transmembrane protein 258-like [Lipotes vexillifer]|uniref:Dolichyl-diphosphooligosaccharide-protein glycosyltransferase subunit TMEM258 n=1 Tax=Lipotes vexillifer TaxID=118797 RepID=A0A340X950_LIPVE|nr:PREDICTED: transmembrane protein 258-like [Lipotes vexillifer]
MELESLRRYTSPVNLAVFPHLTVGLLAIGMFFTAWFFIYEVTSTKYTWDIYKELLISLVASFFMGFGVLFLLRWVSIYNMNSQGFQPDVTIQMDLSQPPTPHPPMHLLPLGLP